ncbi:MAG: alpha/beta hydrolase [Rhodanobacteraceae bacterium]
MKFDVFKFVAVLSLALLSNACVAATETTASSATDEVHYRTIGVGGVQIFYREAGRKDAPALLLLHGFPTSSQMYRDLIPRLAGSYHVVAPDYPGYGYSEMPDRAKFSYTFATYAELMDQFTRVVGIDHFAMYVMDYGAPVGYRLALRDPKRVTAFIVQNGNAYDEGLEAFWDPIKAYWKTGAPKEREALRWLTTIKATEWQYTNGARDTSLVDPDAWTIDQARMDRPGNADVQLDLLYDYRTNVPLYPQFQAYFRRYKPPMLIVWGKNDEIFPSSGAVPYRRDLPDVEVHMLDAGHFALETNGPEIAQLILAFLDKTLPSRAADR